MIQHQIFHVSHDLRISEVGVGGDGFEAFAVFLGNGGGLGMKHKGDRQQALQGVRVYVRLIMSNIL